MKNTILLFVTAIICVLGLSSFTTTPKHGLATFGVTGGTVVWKTESIDVGEIPQGTPKTFEFEFKNTGSTPIVITSAHASCGCTVADYPKDSIAPGKSATIKATYNAANKGAFTKTVTVTTTENDTPKVLTIKGTVI
ncbi:MAG: hypothetical protein CFE23_01990 [Flavobacterium sp. BFFFF1]|uniref:DUF1573 domain-containing protein n=1 Tax=Flavobacterium sp. BFFFF1 TaxID=2015557 RepID=UPI000BD95F6A|nr:DUF1573 domain-containing protein [Flavobacterium sp. BFFFF1]OYU82091.1 MAG: hypothetical protein CFE23_01990 [Flavobacterium sp. BFFFF1]